MRVLFVLALLVVAANAIRQTPATASAPASTLDQNIKELQGMVGDLPANTANTTAPAPSPVTVSNATTAANATAAPAAPAPAPAAAPAPANASAPVQQVGGVPANATNDTDAQIAFARREDTNPATNITVRLFMEQIPTVNVDNTSDPTDKALISQTIRILNQLIKIDLNGRFTGGHGIYFRHRMWKHLLTQTERALLYLKRVLEAQMSLHDASKERLHGALARVKECLRQIKLLKSEGAALRIDLATLTKRLNVLKDLDLSTRLRTELKESEKLMGERQVEVKKAKEAVTAATQKLQNSIQGLSTVMENIVGRMVFQSSVINELNPMKDNAGLANILEIIQQQITEKQGTADALEKSAEQDINEAIRLRGTDAPFREKQIVHFSDEVMQYQRRADMLSKLLGDAKARLQEANTTTPTVVA